MLVRSFFSLLLLAISLQAAPKGVVLLIADGTSLELLTAARIYQGGVASKLNLETMPQSAFVSTYSYDGMVTDSGAAATALARGFKADNQSVGSPPPGKPGAPSIVDLAKKAGWATGVITDDSVTGGTPAPFVIEHDHREQEFIIANLEAQNLGKNCDFLLGGGQRFFQGTPPSNTKNAPIFAATVSTLTASNIQVFDTWDKWLAASPTDLQKPILGIFAPEKLDFIADGDRKPHLEDMVSEGLRLLQSSGKPWLLVA
jgi:alkaline phosphatase